MNYLLKKSIATAILLTLLTVNTWAEDESPCGDMQCPLASKTVNVKFDKDQRLDVINEFITKLLETVGYCF